jgi:hypothetical protein
MENRLLAALPREELEALRPHFERVSLAHGVHAIAPDEPIRDVYFPLNCLLSLVTTMEDGATVESGRIGREGMSGIPVLLDAARTPMPTFVQIAGAAIKAPSQALKSAYDERPAVHRLLNRYVHTVIVTGGRTRRPATGCTSWRRGSASGS